MLRAPGWRETRKDSSCGGGCWASRPRSAVAGATAATRRGGLPGGRQRLPLLRGGGGRDAARPSPTTRRSSGASRSARATRDATIWALKVSDNVAVDEAEPEVLFDAGQHAREHLTVEMALYILGELTRHVRHRRAHPQPPSTAARSGSSRASTPTARSSTSRPGGYVGLAQEPPAQRRLGGRRHGPQPQLGLAVGLLRRLEPATRVGGVPRRVARSRRPRRKRCATSSLSRRVGGVQQIKTSIDFHSYGELVMWPYAYTYADTAPGMSAEQRDAFAALGQSMAQTNGYTPQQASRPLHLRRQPARLAVGQRGDLRLRVRAVPGPSSGGRRLLPARRGHRGADVAQPRGGPAARRDRRLPVPRERPAGEVLRRARPAAPSRRRRPPPPPAAGRPAAAAGAAAAAAAADGGGDGDAPR